MKRVLDRDGAVSSFVDLPGDFGAVHEFFLCGLV